MSRSVIQVSVPSTELVQLSDMSPLVHGYPDNEASFLSMVIAAARDHVEQQTGYSLMPRSFIQFCDRFPMQSLFSPMLPVPLPYIGLAPGGAWSGRRSPYEITLLRGPAQAVTQIVYNDATGTPQTLLPGVAFSVDLTSTPARVLPLPAPLGTFPITSYWPICTPGPQAVAIYFSAGYYTSQDQLTTDALPRDLGFPPILKLLVMQLAAHWFVYRDLGSVPPAISDLINANRVVDYNPSIE